MRKFLENKFGISRVAILGVIVVIIVVAVVAGYIVVNYSTRQTQPASIITQTPPSLPPVTSQAPSTQVRFELTIDDSKAPWAFLMNGQRNPDLKVSLGSTAEIVLKNTGTNSAAIVHNISIDEFGVTGAKTQIAQGRSVTITFTADKPGTFTYYCSVPGHKEQGLKGNIIVS